MYKLIRNNQVIALVDEPRYVKQKASSGAWIKCPRGEADGIAVGGQVYGLGEVYPVAVDNGEYLLELGGKVDEANEVNSIVFVTLAENETIDEVTALEHEQYFEEWEQPVAYVIGNIRRYNEKLYKCIQAHTSQADWTPDVSVSLWREIGDPAAEWPEWSQPIGASDAYMMGDKVTYEGQHYISQYDNNVWCPTVYGWEAVA